MKKIITIFTLAFLIFSLSACNKIQEIKNTDKKIKITTSIVPLASIANYVGWKYVEAHSLVPAGVSPESFNLKPNQMIDIQKSDLIVYLWLEHIDWFLNKAVEGKKNIVLAKDWIELLKWENHDKNKEGGEEEEEHHHHEEEWHDINPHIWSNSANAYIIAKHIVNELVKIQPENAEYFNKNLQSFKSKLELAKNDFIKNTKNKKQNHFINFHDAYGYLYKELNVNETKKHIFRANVLSDPNSSDMKNLIDDIKKDNIKVAFKEPQLDASSLQKLGKEYNLTIFTLDPLGTDESADWYIKNYTNNLKSLENIYK